MDCLHRLSGRQVCQRLPLGWSGWQPACARQPLVVSCRFAGSRPSYSGRGSQQGGRRSSSGGGGRGRGRQGAGGGGRGKVTPASRPPPQPRVQPLPATTDDNFADAVATLKANHANQQVIRKESWERLCNLMRNEQHAHEAFALLQADAVVRDATGWDWAAQGYGQTVTQLVGAAAAVGAHDIAQHVITHAESLHLNVTGKDFMGALIRRVAAGGASVEALLQLYDRERQMHGRNTHMSAHELSRVYRRNEDIKGVQAILQQVEAGEADVKSDLVDTLTTWLTKRGVTV